MNVEHGTFTSLVFPLTGGEGPEASMFHKYIAQKISAETEENYDRVLSLIRCKLFFFILRSIFLCVKGRCSVSNDHVHLNDLSLFKQVCSSFCRPCYRTLTLAVRKVSLSLTDVNISFVPFKHFSSIYIFLFSYSLKQFPVVNCF